MLFLNKPDGLWNDEYISWMVASVPFGQGFLKAIIQQCHMPLYYFYLKVFAHGSDFVLRLSSVITGIAGIIAMYFVGKEKDEQTGLYCAGFTAISSFLIYFSQEVRLYSLLFLISALALLYTMRLLRLKARNDAIFCVIFNLLILLTHTIGFVFVFFNLVLISAYLYKQYKKFIIILWSSIAAGTLALSPLAIKVFTTHSFSQWWGVFSPAKLAYIVTDYFSPVLTNIVNSPDKFYLNLFMLAALIPIIFLITAIKQDKFNLALFGTAAGTMLVLTIAAMCGKLVLLTKYSIEIYPVLIYLICAAQIPKKKVWVIAYCVMCFVYMALSPVAAFKIRRPEGHKIVADMLKRAELQDGDIILLEYYPSERFERYFDFSKYKVLTINKGNFNEFLTPNTTYNEAYKNGKEIYQNIFEGVENKYFSGIINSELKKGKNIAVVSLSSVSFYKPEEVAQITHDRTKYSRTPFLFLVFSYVKNQTYYELMKACILTRYEEKGNWGLAKFTKLNK